MPAVNYERWSADRKEIPRSINEQLVGTFPSIVLDNKTGMKIPAFFIRSQPEEEFFAALQKGKATCTIKPQFVKTPAGPLVMVYGMVNLQYHKIEPFISETALFPRLASMPSHREIAELLASAHDVYYIICDEAGACIFNGRAYVLDAWREELVEKSEAFDEGAQITDEKAAISSLYWYQDKFTPTPAVFEVNR